MIIICSLVTTPQPVLAAAEPTYVLDPNLTEPDQTNAARVRNAITKAATEYGYTDFTVVIYAPTTAGANWAFSELSKISCPLGPVESMITGIATADVFLGKCIVFKAVEIANPYVAKDTETVAYHEIFHLAQAFRGGLKTGGAHFDDMRWMYEGTAEFAGYQPQIASGKRTQDELISLRRGDAIRTASSLTQVSNAWVDNSIALVSDPVYRTNAMYGRSYLAAYYLTTVSSEEKVLNDYFAESGRSGDHVSAFVTTFGMTVSEFDANFTAWLNAWTAPITVTTTVPTTTTASKPPAVQATPTVSTKKTATLKAIATFGKLTIPTGAKLSAVVAAPSRRICRIIGTKVKGIKKGTCRVVITVKSKSGAKITRTIPIPVRN